VKRIVLFVATNVAVLAVLALTASLLGFAAVFGMGGSFVSLALSKWMAKRMTGSRVIQQNATPTEEWLVGTVRRRALAGTKRSWP
jgi:heat shock protein HtpX